MSKWLRYSQESLTVDVEWEVVALPPPPPPSLDEPHEVLNDEDDVSPPLLFIPLPLRDAHLIRERFSIPRFAENKTNQEQRQCPYFHRSAAPYKCERNWMVISMMNYVQHYVHKHNLTAYDHPFFYSPLFSSSNLFSSKNSETSSIGSSSWSIGCTGCWLVAPIPSFPSSSSSSRMRTTRWHWSITTRVSTTSYNIHNCIWLSEEHPLRYIFYLLLNSSIALTSSVSSNSSISIVDKGWISIEDRKVRRSDQWKRKRWNGRGSGWWR